MKKLLLGLIVLLSVFVVGCADKEESGSVSDLKMISVPESEYQSLKQKVADLQAKAAELDRLKGNAGDDLVSALWSKGIKYFAEQQNVRKVSVFYKGEKVPREFSDNPAFKKTAAIADPATQKELKEKVIERVELTYIDDAVVKITKFDLITLAEDAREKGLQKVQ